MWLAHFGSAVAFGAADIPTRHAEAPLRPAGQVNVSSLSPFPPPRTPRLFGPRSALACHYIMHNVTPVFLRHS